MKNIITVLSAVLISICSLAQAPQKMNYQAVVRDGNSELITDQQVGMQISILQGSASGTEVYVETQTPTTNGNGLMTLEIGSGTVITGDFTGIDWADGPYFIKTETDPTGGTSYSIEGTSELLSVPYALYAADSESIWSENGSNIAYNNGNVGIGTESPDEPLVIGNPLGLGFNIPALTVGGESGGGLTVGTPSIRFLADATTIFDRTRLIATDETGYGMGKIEMRTSQLNVGTEPGVSDNDYALRVVHDSWGFNLERSSTGDIWEFHINSSGELNLYSSELNNVGSFDPTSGNYSASSDERLKTNITQLGSVLSPILQLKPKSYNYKTDLSKNYIGFLAQELQETFPEVVTEAEGRNGAESTFLVDYSQLTVLAIRAVQEQQEIIEEQNKKISDLEERLERLENLIDE